nr:thioredoxin domain-containing protein 8 isoform X2 [Microcebus murinus]
MVEILKDMNEFKTFLQAAGHKLVVVEFSAKWCGPCQRMYPIFHAMSLQYQNVFFANVDVDASPDLAESCHIRAIPTFQMFKKKEKVNLFSRIKRIICCYRSGFVVKQIYEFCGADGKKLEEKIKQLIYYSVLLVSGLKLYWLNTILQSHCKIA